MGTSRGEGGLKSHLSLSLFHTRTCVAYLFLKASVVQLLRTGLHTSREEHDAERHHCDNFVHDRHSFTYIYEYMHTLSLSLSLSCFPLRCRRPSAFGVSPC